MKQGGCFALIVGEDLESPIVVDVAHGETARRVRRRDSGPSLGGNIREPAVTQVSIENGALAEAQVRAFSIDLGKHVAADQNQVAPAIVVEVEELASPTHVAGI